MDSLTVTAMVLSVRPIGDYDSRVVLLTRERGKISVFARGAKRPKSRLSAIAPFTYGKFELREGSSSYTMYNADVENYFESLRADIEGACYGFYCLEIADYFGRENNDEWEMLKLLYTTIRALEKGVADRRLIRCIYEFRVMAVNGFGPPTDRLRVDPVTRYAMDYSVEAPYRQLYAIAVKEDSILKFREENDLLLAGLLDRPIRSKEMLELIISQKESKPEKS